MNTKNNAVPKLRFPDFTDAWEQRKLELLASFTKGNGYSKGDLTNKGFPIILYGRLYTKYQSVINEVDTFVSNILSSTIKSSGKEVIVPASGETAEDIARASAVIKQDVILGGDLNIITPLPIINPIFLALVLSYGRQQRDLAKCAQGKSVVHLRNNDLKEVNLIYPTLAEQTAIGNFFKQLDEAIASHQRKYERMKKLKQSMLQKMFPRDGEAFPELRFPNFTDAWEQRKLNQISSKVTQKNTDGVYIETFTNSAEFGIVSQRDFFDKDISNSSNLNGYYVVKHNDFVYNPRISNSAPVGPIKRNKLGRTGVMSPLYYVFRTDGIVHEFLETYFSSNHWHRFMEENGDTGARADRFAIKDKLFAQMPIPFPIHEEQTAIGNFFKQLDEAIASHQRKLEHMQTLKKGLLQQMFV
ncbi:restriction endonuclease subunit S [Testudinibacter sp. P17/SS/0325]